ncbi:bifunctional precorrin-2 dehydrogenase/sirohydrochlorin ferrochelatase [soil metagenome]
MSAQAKNRLLPENFYPLSLSLKDKEVLVFGGDLAACNELLRLLEAGASVTVVAAAFVSEIQELHVSYGNRLELVRVSEVKYLEKCQGLSRFSLVFALSSSEMANENAAALAASSGVPIYRLGYNGSGQGSNFVPVTIFKRGHVKIAVSTDGICPPLETALMQRIEEVLASDFDRYSLFVDSVSEQLNSYSVESQVGESSQTWTAMKTSEALASALSRNNFEEALGIIRQLQMRTAAGEQDNEEAV